MNLLAFVYGCGPYGHCSGTSRRLEKLREEKSPSLILGEGPDGLYKTLLPFPDYKLPTEKGCMSRP